MSRDGQGLLISRINENSEKLIVQHVSSAMMVAQINEKVLLKSAFLIVFLPNHLIRVDDMLILFKMEKEHYLDNMHRTNKRGG